MQKIDKIKIKNVITEETIATELFPLPNVFSACTPTKIAPTVCAIVFNVKIVIKGLEIEVNR